MKYEIEEISSGEEAGIKSASIRVEISELMQI